MNYVYMLRCADGSLYTGWTTDPERRLKSHNTGRGAKYTRSRRPVELVYLERWDTRGQALSREAQIKALSRSEKLLLLKAFSSGGENLKIGFEESGGFESI